MKKLRILIPLGILALAGIAFATNVSVGNISSFGWETISLLCPVGALGTMLASKTMIPRAVISVALAVAAIILLGRAFCGWVCPVPVLSKLRDVFRKDGENAGKNAAAADADAEGDAEGDAATTSATATPLSAQEKAALASSCKGGCAACADRKPADSRHFVLGGALLSAAIFGFPVFCLICPIGLSFALVFLLILLFGGGDVTWSLVVIPLILLAEVVFFRKWCSHLCPLSSLMSLIGRANRTVLPAIDNEKCLETAYNATCGRCGSACEVGIDPRHPERGAGWQECTRCRACIDVCPGNAISMPLFARRPASPRGTAADGSAGNAPQPDIADEPSASPLS